MEKNKDRDAKGRIIDLATDLFLQNGFAGTSMSAIAKASGMTKASLYYHFANKEDLFIACVTDGYQHALSSLETIVADDQASPEEKLSQAFDTLYDTVINSAVGRMSPLIAEVSRAFPQVARSFREEYILPHEALVAQILAQGTKAGVFKPIDKKLMSHLFIGPIVTLSLSREMFAKFDDLDEHFPVDELKAGHLEAIKALIVIK